MKGKERSLLDRLVSRLVQGSRSVELEEMDFETFEEVETIRVMINLEELKTIRDATTIRAVLAFLRGHREGWCIPWEGVPIESFTLEFRRGDVLLGNVGVDRTFLTTHRVGGFWSKDLDESESSKLLRIIGMSDYGDE